jgi:hypothetical protein
VTKKVVGVFIAFRAPLHLPNTALFEHGLVMTASAIGDNLVKSVFYFGKTKPKLLVQRGLTPRDVAEF